MLGVREFPFDCFQAVGTDVLLVCVCTGSVIHALVESLVGLGSRPDRGIVGAIIPALSGPGWGAGGGSRGGERLNRVQDQHFAKTPDTVEGSYMLPPIKLHIQHQLLHM